MKRKSTLIPVIVSALLGGIALTSCGPSDDQQQKQEEVTLTKIQVINPKTNYSFNENFVKPTVEAVYSDGKTKVVTENLTFSGFNSKQPGDQIIIVMYKESGKSYQTTYKVTVSESAVLPEKIEVKGTYKTQYELDEELVKPTIIATYPDKTEVNVTTDCAFVYDFSTEGEKTVLVRYVVNNQTFETSFNVTVISTATTKLKFAVFADVQLCAPEAGEGKAANLGETANAPLALEQHLKYIKSQGINVVLMDGDVTNQANENYYSYFESIVAKVYGSDKSAWPEFIWNMGNHEWWHGTTENDPRTGEPGNYVLPDGAINSVEMFNSHARIESDNLVKRSAIKYATNVSDTLPSYYKVINGVPFLVISAVNSSGLITDELKAEINTWLSEIKQLESVKAGGPIFVQYHYPLGTSMTHGQGSHEQNTNTIDDIFGNIPNAVIFTGDTHFPGNNERSINQVNYTTINLGTSSYSRMVDESAVICDNYENVTGGNKGDGRGEIAQGNAGYKNAYTPNIQIVEVLSNNSTKINRYMSTEDGSARKVGEQWTLKPTTSKSTFEYTNARFQNKNAALKLYGKEGVSWDEEEKVTFEVNEEEKQMTVHFNDPEEYHFVEHYDIKVNGVSHDFVSNYYKYLETPEENYYVIENLPTADSYSVEVTAYDFFDNPSLNKLTASTETDGKAIDPIDLYFADGNYNYSDVETRNNFEYTAEGSNSSSEFYYRGIQDYRYGAILGRLISDKALKVTDYLSIEPGEGSKPTVTFDVKNLKDDDLVFGLSVVTKDGDWKTDFGAEYQKTVSGKEWTTLSWDLNQLFGLSSKESLGIIAIKAKSKAASANGYEMNFLVDNVDIINNGDTPIPPSPSTDRGQKITAGEDLVIDLKKQVQLTEKISVDFKLDKTNTTGKVSISLLDNACPDWADYFGYYSFFSNGTMENTTPGVSISQLSDGYFRVTFNLPELVKIHAQGLPTTYIDTVYVRGGDWTTINGRIDINQPGDVYVVRGQRFFNATDLAIDLDSSIKLTETIKIDVKFDNPVESNVIEIMLGQGWNQYFGYFKVFGNGTLGSTYNGVSATSLDDGYTRLTFNLSELTKVEDMPKPNEYIDLIYLRGKWAAGDGYIDINPTEGNPIRGNRFVNAADFTKDYKTEHFALTDTFVFDIKFDNPTSENVVAFMLGQEWSKYYGYYKVKGDGTLNDTYNGVSIITLSDGYYRVTLDLAQLTKVDDKEPDSYINLFYIAGRYSTGGGYIDLNPTK